MKIWTSTESPTRAPLPRSVQTCSEMFSSPWLIPGEGKKKLKYTNVQTLSGGCPRDQLQSHESQSVDGPRCLEATENMEGAWA